MLFCFSTVYNNQNMGMQNKYSKWPQQEEQMILQLKQSQNGQQRVNWKKIAIKLNEAFKSNKSSRECKVYYEKHIKLWGQPSLTVQWKSEEIQILVDSYLQHGSSWSKIADKLQAKDQNLVKNKFYNEVRKALRLIWSNEKRCISYPYKKISYEVIIIILDLSSQLKKWFEENQIDWSKEVMIFRFQRDFIRLCFYTDTIADQEVIEIIKLLRNISAKLKTHGLFKIKNRKHWKLTEACIKSILKIENLAHENHEYYRQKLKSQGSKRKEIGEENENEEEKQTRSKENQESKQLLDLVEFDECKHKNWDVEALQLEVKDVIGEQMIREFEASREQIKRFIL